MTVTITRHSFSVDDYARMRLAGILTEDDRVELLDGEVRQMSPIGSFHAALVNRLAALLMRMVGDRAIVSIQNPIQLNDYSEPQPDLVILAPRADYYAHAHPRPDDVLVIIEISDSTAAYDRDEKIPRYAAAGIEEAWLIDVAAQHIEQYTHPKDAMYRQKVIWTLGKQLQSPQHPYLVLTLTSVFTY
ncbi:MAG: Uma2 family endonuclease [Roseiflexaceae bacterium]